VASSPHLGDGTSHEKTGLPCQDAGCCWVVADQDGGDVLLAIACDGAGSASRSLDGATLAVDRFVQDFGAASRRLGLEAITKEFVEDWLSRVRAEIRDHAETDGLSPREFACTILGAVVGSNRAAFFQIGDGAMVVSNRDEPDDYGWVFWPQHGEFANQTNFITEDNALEAVEFELEERCVDEIAMLPMASSGSFCTCRRRQHTRRSSEPCLAGWSKQTRRRSVRRYQHRMC